MAPHVRTLVVLLLPWAALVLSAAEEKPVERIELHKFDGDIAENFVSSHDRSAVLARAATEKRPILVLLMTKWCDACLVMRASINSGQLVRQLLPHFVVAYAEADKDIKAWQDPGDEYIPQAKFMNSEGEPLPVHGPSTEHKRYFGDDATLANGMLQALRLVEHPVVMNLAEKFDADVAASFSAVTDRAALLAKAKAEGKVVMVILMSKACWDCLLLRASVNKGKQVRWLLSRFLVVYLESDFKEWKEDGHHYVPQVNFFDGDGKRLSVSAVSGYKHFFGSDATLAAAMRKALHLTSGKGSKNVLTGKIPSPFDHEITKHVRGTVEPWDLAQMSREENKPLMVFVTEPWCTVCQGMIKSINEGRAVRELLPSFVVAHAQDDDAIAKWQDEHQDGYVPQVIFLDSDGGLLGIEGANADYRHFFENDESVADAMQRALSAFSAISKKEL